VNACSLFVGEEDRDIAEEMNLFTETSLAGSGFEAGNSVIW
jgi:hypothetical protein